jgi:hypothetical protein
MKKVFLISVLLYLGLVIVSLLSISGRPNPSEPLSINLTPLEASVIKGANLLVHPLPDAALTLNEYERGMKQTRLDGSSGIYNICILADPFVGNHRLCELPGIPSTPGTPCPTFQSPTASDFWNNVEVFLDGRQINGGRIGRENTLEEPHSYLYDAYNMCYCIALEVGIHRMKYIFRWPPENITDAAEWEFTIIKLAATH